jgi:hypothetical protein
VKKHKINKIKNMKRNGLAQLKRKYTRKRENEYKKVISLWALVKGKKSIYKLK